ncbi:hypothetical protein H632_c838p0 [Helicosporidium sp. ATCC 50920]|nr:hypothetical protein H632_c838p0 [Helicosporidium sp. ATCC 50920]|eukprot:KDD75156.1 hypothetical protein H632_c838p0 [Helicosporidium sp. ATCC 50920]
MILAEWLCEVAMDWNLENTLVFKAMSYLDYYMTLQPVQMLSKFQLLGLACLRAAMGDARKPTALVSEADKALDAQRFAHVSDDTYTVEEVEQVTQLISGLVPDRLKTAPNMKMFLRSFWYRASLTGVLCAEEMHVYTLASFFLQLSLLDLSCCAYSASLLAAASLCQALVFFGREGWPLPLQRFGSYRPEELEGCRARLRDLAARVECPELRRLWLASHEQHGYDEFREEWKRLLDVLRAPADVSGGGEEAMEQD